MAGNGYVGRMAHYLHRVTRIRARIEQAVRARYSSLWFRLGVSIVLVSVPLVAVPITATIGAVLLVIGSMTVLAVLLPTFIRPISTIEGEVIDAWVEGHGGRSEEARETVLVTAVLRYKNHGRPGQIDDFTATLETPAAGPWDVNAFSSASGAVSGSVFLPKAIQLKAASQPIKEELWLTGAFYGKLPLQRTMNVTKTKWRLEVVCFDGSHLPVTVSVWIDGSYRPNRDRDFRAV